MPRNKSPPKQLRQQDLFGFFAQPSSSSSPLKAPPALKASPAKRKRGSRAKVIEISDDEEPDSDVEGIRFEPRKVPALLSENEDEDQSPRRPKGKRRRVAESRTVSPPAASVIDLDTDNEEPVAPSKRWKGKGVTRRRRVDNSGSDTDELPKARKLMKGVRPPTPEDIEEVDQTHILDTRMRSRDKKSAFQKNLDKLKRKKQGKTPLSSSEEDEEDEGEFEDVVPFAGARPDGGLRDEDEDPGNAEDGFIVDDDDAVPELPSAFSMSTHQDFSHHFKIVCQLFVHLAVTPERDRRTFMKDTLTDNEYFSVPLQVARRKLSGVRDSLASSVWRADYRKSLLQYPKLTLTSLAFAVPHCDACHLGGRLSTLVGHLSGSPYDAMSFQPINRKSATHESDDDEGENSDDTSNRSHREFNLGRFCAARTQMFHRLAHWEYDLYYTLLAEVDQLRQPLGPGKRSFVRVAFAKGLQPPEDLSDADGIMDWLDERGRIHDEWQKVRDLMQRASNLEATKEDDIDLDVS
ncbi:hypothetical protein FA95DRAFT_1551909 [Auriscalpium vulgare]|uniref:Uncharacterized protein n=1 Tax=Auriscalpium vulgare TaxID=40419 RepID=A0ACB8SCR1_9AGAM|nr:hypothetical protein FA95DRAFT_1551909 [Auriscalpium vulgare]